MVSKNSRPCPGESLQEALYCIGSLCIIGVYTLYWGIMPEFRETPHFGFSFTYPCSALPGLHCKYVALVKVLGLSLL